MMKLLSYTFLSCLLAAQLLIGAEQPSDNGQRSSVGDKAVEFAQYQEAQVKRLAAQSQIQTNASALQSRGLYYTSHPAAFQTIATIGFFNDTVEIQDGSIWSVSLFDQNIVSYWMPGDLIVITPNYNPFSSYRFRMINQTTLESVDVNLYLGPFYMGAYTYQIVTLNDYSHQLILNDGSLWNISELDASIMAHWYPSDVIIIGINDGLFSASLPNVLINVNTLDYVEAIHY